MTFPERLAVLGARLVALGFGCGVDGWQVEWQLPGQRSGSAPRAVVVTAGGSLDDTRPVWVYGVWLDRSVPVPPVEAVDVAVLAAGLPVPPSAWDMLAGHRERDVRAAVAAVPTFPTGSGPWRRSACDGGRRDSVAGDGYGDGMGCGDGTGASVGVPPGLRAALDDVGASSAVELPDGVGGVWRVGDDVTVTFLGAVGGVGIDGRRSSADVPPRLAADVVRLVAGLPVPDGSWDDLAEVRGLAQWIVMHPGAPDRVRAAAALEGLP